MIPHGNARHDGWWYRASKEQRLAQIDAAIDLGMNARQTAMCLGCLWEMNAKGAGIVKGSQGDLVETFARRNGRNFQAGMSAKASRDGVDKRRVAAAKRIAAKSGHLIDAAFDIFGTHQLQSDSLFDELSS